MGKPNSDLVFINNGLSTLSFERSKMCSFVPIHSIFPTFSNSFSNLIIFASLTQLEISDSFYNQSKLKIPSAYFPATDLFRLKKILNYFLALLSLNSINLKDLMYQFQA